MSTDAVLSAEPASLTTLDTLPSDSQNLPLPAANPPAVPPQPELPLSITPKEPAKDTAVADPLIRGPSDEPMGLGEHPKHHDHHYSHRSPWLRAAVLGANDGLVSVASLMMGVAAGGTERQIVFLSGLSALVAGALSMALGEYVSVSSQRDAEEADLKRERREFMRTPAPHYAELEELSQIYVSRGLPTDLARQVAEHFHHSYTVDELVKIHARDELGIDADELSNPFQAAFFSLLAFAVGGVLPLLGAGFIDEIHVMIGVLVGITCVGLAVFGALGARLGGAPMLKASVRVLIGGAIALGITFGIGKAFGVASG